MVPVVWSLSYRIPQAAAVMVASVACLVPMLGWLDTRTSPRCSTFLYEYYTGQLINTSGLRLQFYSRTFQLTNFAVFISALAVLLACARRTRTRERRLFRIHFVQQIPDTQYSGIGILYSNQQRISRTH